MGNTPSSTALGATTTGYNGFFNLPFPFSFGNPTPVASSDEPEYTYTTIVVLVPNNGRPSYTTITSLIPVTTTATLMPVISTYTPVATLVTMSATVYTAEIRPSAPRPAASEPTPDNLFRPTPTTSPDTFEFLAPTPDPAFPDPAIPDPVIPDPANSDPGSPGDPAPPTDPTTTVCEGRRPWGSRRSGPAGKVEVVAGDLNIFDYDEMIEEYYSSHPNTTPVPVNTITSVERVCEKQWGPCRFVPKTTTIWRQERQE
ncbi:hypothetical protein DFH27DRAFT_602141 [Peziza echinospora]|nr:hypothetical protein DFH27DRAFT_602141 [Peziza echinospora]